MNYTCSVILSVFPWGQIVSVYTKWMKGKCVHTVFGCAPIRVTFSYVIIRIIRMYFCFVTWKLIWRCWVCNYREDDSWKRHGQTYCCNINFWSMWSVVLRRIKRVGLQMKHNIFLTSVSLFQFSCWGNMIHVDKTETGPRINWWKLFIVVEINKREESVEQAPF